METAGGVITAAPPPMVSRSSVRTSTAFTFCPSMGESCWKPAFSSRSRLFPSAAMHSNPATALLLAQGARCGAEGAGQAARAHVGQHAALRGQAPERGAAAVGGHGEQ